MLPLFNQIILPTFLGVYAVIASLFPFASTPPAKENTKSVVEKNTAQTHVTPTTAVLQKGIVSQATKQQKNTLKTEIQKNEQKTSNGNQSSKVSVTPAAQVLPSPTETVAKIVTANSQISANGKTIQLFMQYPSLGGAVSGTISGDCSGTISGTYSGSNGQTLSGKGSANCPMGFLTVPVTIQYSGTLLSPNLAQITYTLNALGKSETGTTTLTLTQ